MPVHPTAIVSSEARIPDGAQIGPFTIIGPTVTLLAGTTIGSHCSIGLDGPEGEVVVGADSRIRSHTVIYRDVSIGDRLETGHRVTIREGSRIGIDFQAGTLNDIEGNCLIGDHVRFHSNVHIGQLSEVRDFVWIFPYVVLTNDPHPPSEGHLRGVVVEEFASIATMAVVLPGVTVGRDSLVGAHTLVTRDVRAGSVVTGVPGKDRGEASDIRLADDSGPAYPWRRHFHRGYPEEVVRGWISE